MCALESAFVNTVITGEQEKGIAPGTTTTSSCVQRDTTEKKISGLKMWKWRSVERDKSEYVLL